METLATGLHGPSDLVLADGWLYYSDGSQLARVPAAGGFGELLGKPEGRPLRIAVSGNVLVWTEGGIGTAVHRLTL